MSTPEFIRFLCIARGSLAEIETQITIACRLGFIDETTENLVLDETAVEGKMLHALIRSLERRNP